MVKYKKKYSYRKRYYPMYKSPRTPGSFKDIHLFKVDGIVNIIEYANNIEMKIGQTHSGELNLVGVLKNSEKWTQLEGTYGMMKLCGVRLELMNATTNIQNLLYAVGIGIAVAAVQDEHPTFGSVLSRDYKVVYNGASTQQVSRYCNLKKAYSGNEWANVLATPVWGRLEVARIGDSLVDGYMAYLRVTLYMAFKDTKV